MSLFSTKINGQHTVQLYLTRSVEDDNMRIKHSVMTTPVMPAANM